MSTGHSDPVKSFQGGDELGSGNHDNPQGHILLHAMAEQTNNKTELRNESLQALMAAQETTAVLISNVFFVLSRHPSVWQQLRVEVLSLMSQELNFDLLQNMKYLRKVLNESERPNSVYLSWTVADLGPSYSSPPLPCVSSNESRCPH